MNRDDPMLGPVKVMLLNEKQEVERCSWCLKPWNGSGAIFMQHEHPNMRLCAVECCDAWFALIAVRGFCKAMDSGFVKRDKKSQAHLERLETIRHTTLIAWKKKHGVQ